MLSSIYLSSKEGAQNVCQDVNIIDEYCESSNLEMIQECVAIQDKEYPLEHLQALKKFPEVFEQYLRRKRLGMNCKFYLEMTGNVYWNYINMIYFPIDGYRNLEKPDRVFKKVKRHIRESVEEIVEVTDNRKIQLFKADHVKKAIEDIMKNPQISQNKNHQNVHKEESSNILSEVSNMTPFPSLELPSDEFSDLNFNLEQSEEYSQNTKISRGDVQLKDLILVLQERLDFKRKENKEIIGVIKGELKERRYDPKYVPQLITEDIIANRDTIELPENVHTLNSRLPFSQDIAQMKLTANQNMQYERRQLAMATNNGKYTKAFDLKLTPDELMSLDTDFVNIDDACLVCSKGEYTKDNLIVYCDLCNCMVHQKCYDLKVIPEGEWLCYKCRVFEKKHLNLLK